MKSISAGSVNPEWNNNLVKDLSFIKKHLRYPLTKKTLGPVVVLGVLLAFVARFAIFALYLNDTTRHQNLLLNIVMMALLGISLFGFVWGYVRLYRFAVVPTTFFELDNQQLIIKFLTAQQLAVFRHPEVPGVFQIISRNIGYSKKEEREVMVFIADDKRILINSHYTKVGFFSNRPSRNYLQMAKMLKVWAVANNDPLNVTSVPVRSF